MSVFAAALPVVAAVVAAAWPVAVTVARWFLRGGPHAPRAALWCDVAVELRPSFLPALGVFCGWLAAGGRWGWAAAYAVAGVAVWLLGPGGDGRWRRRRRRLAARVSRIGARLTAAPAPAAGGGVR